MLEILVSVGIVSLLIGVATPAYNQYKKSSTNTAIKADLSNLVKAYNANNAVNASYCATWADVGFSAGESNLYAKKAFLGFNTANTVNCNITAANSLSSSANDVLHVKTDADVAGTCNGKVTKKKSECTGAGVTWDDKPDAIYSASPAACVLDEGEFLAGATTGVSGLDIFYTMDEDAKVDSSGDNATGNCTDPA